MKRILFTPGIGAVDALGTVTRLIAVADEIRRINPEIEILFRSAGVEAEYIKMHQFKVVSGYRPHLFGLPGLIGKMVDSSDFVGPIPSVNSMKWLINLKGMFSKEYIEKSFTEELKLVEEYQPDYIFSEFDLIIPIVAKKLGVKLFVVGQTPMLKGFQSKIFPPDPKSNWHSTVYYNQLLKRNGLVQISTAEELICEYHSNAIIIPSIPELEEFKEQHRNFYCGSILPEGFLNKKFEWRKVRPLIYIYLSMSQIAPKLYERVLIDTFSRSEFDVIVTAGGNPYFKKKGDYSIGNVHFFQFVPSNKVMQMCDLAIHHGGQNTTIQAISEKVPALIFPGRHFERYFNAQKAAEIGCADNLTLGQFNCDYLYQRCNEMMNNPLIKKKLSCYSQKITAMGGKKRVAEELISNIC